MVSLLDVNLLAAIAWPSHVHHPEAQLWFERNAPLGWATCTVTELGFVRISSNPKIIEDAVSPASAWELLGRLKDYGEHHWVEAAARATFSSLLPLSLMTSHRLVTDFHLVGLAMDSGLCLATLDKKLHRFFSSQSEIQHRIHLVDIT